MISVVVQAGAGEARTRELWDHASTAEARESRWRPLKFEPEVVLVRIAAGVAVDMSDLLSVAPCYE